MILVLSINRPPEELLYRWEWRMYLALLDPEILPFRITYQSRYHQQDSLVCNDSICHREDKPLLMAGTGMLWGGLRTTAGLVTVRSHECGGRLVKVSSLLIILVRPGRCSITGPCTASS